ncbi:MAG: hypothetical protein ACKOZU_07665 [Planctomycetaceae bacterium]
MKQHLLTCSCSHRIGVAAAQAGGSVRCPGCGAEVPVPRLGDLVRLEPAPTAPLARPGRRWSAAHACLLAGVVVAAGTAGAAGWLRGRRATVAPFNERAIAESVSTAAADRVYEAWQTYDRQGIARQPMADEERRSRHAESLAVLERIAWAAAAAGALLAAASVALLVTRARPAATADGFRS